MTQPTHSETIDLSSTVVLQLRTNWKVIVGTLVGLGVGYITMEFRLGRAITAAHDALTAAHEAKAVCEKLDTRLDSLATEREIQDTSHRIDDVVSLLSHAEKVSQEPPKGRHHERSTTR